MGELPNAADDRRPSGEDDGTMDPIDEVDAPALQLSVVRYDERPDRGTIYPPGLSGIDRMETWMSVDLDVLVDLPSRR